MSEYTGLVPPAEGFVQTAQFNFARFAEGPNYREVNNALISKVLETLPGQDIIAVDVAMGHGMVPRLASQILAGTNRRLYIIGVDLDPYAVEQARRQIKDTDEARFTFLQGDAANLRTLIEGHVEPGKVDYTSIHDAIHEIRDDGVKATILKSQADILAPGGLLSYNSTFTTESVGRSWALWQIEFMKIFDARKYEGEDVQKLPIHPSLFYRMLIESTGLTVMHEDLVSVNLSREELEAISEYPPFTNGFTQMMVFPIGVTLEEGTAGMKQAVGSTLERLKTDHLTRKWHEIIAQKAA